MSKPKEIYDACFRNTPEEEAMREELYYNDPIQFLSYERNLQFTHWKKYANTFDYPLSKEDAHELFVLADSYFVWQAFCYLMIKGMTDEAYGPSLNTAYTQGSGFAGAEDFFKSAKKEDLMSEDDMNAYNALPDEVVLYRGTSHKEANTKRKTGLSYTTDRGVAEFFAFRNMKGGGEPITEGRAVITTSVKKTDILAYFVGRNEYEAIISPRKKKFSIVTTLPTDTYYEYMERHIKSLEGAI